MRVVEKYGVATLGDQELKDGDYIAIDDWDLEDGVRSLFCQVRYYNKTGRQPTARYYSSVGNLKFEIMNIEIFDARKV